MRKRVKQSCNKEWKAFCVSGPAPGGIAFFEELRRWPFVIAAQGGGVEPNPQTFMALFAGSIPIIQRFPGEAIFDGLPVIRLDELPSDAINLDQLEKWREEFAPEFFGKRRRAMLEMLTSDFWWSKVKLSLMQ